MVGGFVVSLKCLFVSSNHNSGSWAVVNSPKRDLHAQQCLLSDMRDLNSFIDTIFLKLSSRPLLPITTASLVGNTRFLRRWNPSLQLPIRQIQLLGSHICMNYVHPRCVISTWLAPYRCRKCVNHLVLWAYPSSLSIGQRFLVPLAISHSGKNHIRW